MPRELYQTGTDPEAEKLAKMLNISVLEARRLLNSMEDTSFMQNEKPTMRGGGIASLTQRSCHRTTSTPNLRSGTQR